MNKKHRTTRWMIGSLLVLSLAACQPDPETEETTESSTTAAEITIEPVNLQDQATIDAANDNDQGKANGNDGRNNPPSNGSANFRPSGFLRLLLALLDQFKAFA